MRGEASVSLNQGLRKASQREEILAAVLIERVPAVVKGERFVRLSDRSCCAHDVGLARRQSSTNPFLQIRPARALKSALCPANEQLLDQNISRRSDADRMF